MIKRVLLIGGPSTGKTTLLKVLKSRGHSCMEEISREVIRKAQEEGIEQLFLEKPLQFSQTLKEARIEQHKTASKFVKGPVFYDRGIPDIVAYMEYVGHEIPEEFSQACEKYRYDYVFILPLWKEIYKTDAERYESYEEAQEIQKHLEATYKQYGYTLLEVPQNSPEKRAQFILNQVSSV